MFFILLLGQWVSSSVLSRHSENLKQQTSVTAQLQLSFIWQAKENTSSRHECGPKREAHSLILVPLFIFYFSSP